MVFKREEFMKKQMLWPLLLAFLVGSTIYYFFNRGSLFDQPATEQLAGQQLAECPYDRNFCAYIVAQAKALERGVVIETTTTATDGSSSTSQTRMDGAGSIATTSYLNGELQANVVLYAGQTYVQDLTDQAWYVMRLDFDQAVSNDDANPLPVYSDPRQAYDLQALAQVNKLGTEACGNLMCDKYELLSSREMANATPTYLLIDTSEHLARRLEMISPEGSLVMTYSYDEEVSVEKPYPLKEMSTITFPSGNLDEMPSDVPDQMPSEAPSQQELEEMMQNYGLDG